MSNDLLSEKELHYLHQIERGMFETNTSSPPEIHQLIAKGLVESLTLLAFPNPSSTHHYQLTVYGKYVLRGLKDAGNNSSKHSGNE